MDPSVMEVNLDSFSLDVMVVKERKKIGRGETRSERAENEGQLRPLLEVCLGE